MVLKNDRTKSAAKYINDGQVLLIDVKNWVEGLGSEKRDIIPSHFLDIISQAFIKISFGNNIKADSIDLYLERKNALRTGKYYYDTAKEYLTVVSATYNIKSKRKSAWCDVLYELPKEINGVLKYDKKNALKTFGIDYKSTKAFSEAVKKYDLVTNIDKVEQK